MKDLKTKISKKSYNDLESFFINTNLDQKQRVDLLKIISNIFSDGEFSSAHKTLNNTVGSTKIVASKESPPQSWEFGN